MIDIHEQLSLIKRNTVEIIPGEELVRKIKRKGSLIVKFGVDLYRFGPIGARGDVISVKGKNVFGQPQDGPLVVDNEDMPLALVSAFGVVLDAFGHGAVRARTCSAIYIRDHVQTSSNDRPMPKAL